MPEQPSLGDDTESNLESFLLEKKREKKKQEKRKNKGLRISSLDYKLDFDVQGARN